MAGIVFMAGEAPDLALAEIKGAMKAMGRVSDVESPDNQIAIIKNKPPPGLAARLGFSHFTGTIDDVAPPEMTGVLDSVLSSMHNIDEGHSISWQVKVPKKAADFSSSELFDRIDEMARREGRHVKHRSPDSKIFVIVRKRAYIGRILETSERISSENRRGSRMPFNRPIVMDPRLSRVLVNLSGLPVGSKVLDPFVGPAGLAIEAANLGLNVIGIEKDPEISMGAQVNIEHLGLSDRISIKNGDSRKMTKYSWAREVHDIDGVITDPPFGRSATTGGSDPGELLNDVMGEVQEILPDQAPVVLDSHSPALLENIEGFLLEQMFSFRIHRSMTRHIAILIKK